jgi:hypothetical protein
MEFNLSEAVSVNFVFRAGLTNFGPGAGNFTGLYIIR